MPLENLSAAILFIVLEKNVRFTGKKFKNIKNVFLVTIIVG